jgi:adenylate kinase
MIFVAGISRSGKSSTIEAFAKTRGFTHIKASAMLRNAGRPLGPLSIVEAAENQLALIDLLKNDADTENSTAILDGHAMIETTDGAFPVPDILFDQLNLIKMICIINDPAVIKKSRVESGWRFDLQEIIRLQEIEQECASAQALRLNIPFYKINAHDLSEFAHAINDRDFGLKCSWQ